MFAEGNLNGHKILTRVQSDINMIKTPKVKLRIMWTKIIIFMIQSHDETI